MIGKTISHYKILEKLGEGGMGVVYKAEDTKLDRIVALKFLPADLVRDPDAKQRFIQEAKATSALQHNNICTIHDIDETDDGQLFIVMDCYEGETLKKKIERDSLEIEEAINLTIQIAEGLSKAHEKGIIHRDIKPANIIITSDGVVKILDFGLAKLIGQQGSTKMKLTEGTSFYMSPEQARGEEIDCRTDFWSLGVALYEAITGNLPFKGEYEQAVFYSILMEDYQPVSQIRQDHSTKLEILIDKCLKKNPDERYQNIHELWMDLCDIENEIKNGKRLKVKEKKQHRKIFKMSVYVRTFLLAIVVLLIVLAWGNFRQRFGILNIPEEKHLAIIPFNNIVGDSLSQVFIDGLMETLSSKLTELQRFRGSLWVVPSSELRKQNVNSPSDALRFFGVTLAITGSVQCVKEIITLTLNLVDVKSLRQLESSVIEDRLKNMPAVKDKVIDELTNMLAIDLKPHERKVLLAGETGNSEAYNLYLHGQGYLLRYEKLSNVNTAISLFQQALSKDSQYALAYAGLAKACLRKYQINRNVQLIKDAVNYCNTALKIDNQLALVHVTLGMIYEETGRYSEAIEEFRSTLKLNPVHAEAFMGLAQTNEAIGRYDDAEINYRRAIEIQPGYWAGYNKLGAYYYRRSRYEDAIAQFKQVTILTPDNVRGFNNMGGIYFYIEQWDKAREEFEKSLRIEPNYTAYSNLGTLYFYQGRFADAAMMLEHAVAISGENYKIWGNLASCYYWSEDQKDIAAKTYNKAIEYGERQLSVNPNDPEVLADLAGYYATLGKNKKAINLLERVLALMPTDYSIIFHIGEIYEQLGKRDHALEYIESALKMGHSPAYIDNNPELQDLKNDIRFQKILQEIGK